MALIEIKATRLARVGATLGEGPVWVSGDHAGAGALWFVDIKAPRVHRLDPTTGRLDGWDAPEQVGWVLPAGDGRFLAGLASGLHLFSPADGSFTPHRDVEAHLPGNRLNDAATDPHGRVWFGSMDNGEEAATGRLYVHHRGEVADSGAASAVITNGPAISPDGRTLYAVDTLARTIDAFTLDAYGGLTDRRRFLAIDPALGHPDGATCDVEGGVWVGFWGGWAARRYAPDGTPTHEVRFPVANVTKVAIGGPDGRTGYATTARKGLDDAALAAQPQAGDVFTFDAEVAGVPVREASL
jgi:sugar lactone lactonase YvrE